MGIIYPEKILGFWILKIGTKNSAIYVPGWMVWWICERSNGY